jgi:hypothetical protein
VSDDGVLSTGDPVRLTADEVQSLAWFLAGRMLTDAREWLDWEDVPLLDEGTYDLLVDVVAARGRAMCRSADPPGGHDGAEILGRVQ